MSKPEFDQYAADYDRMLKEAMPSGLGESDYFAEYKVKLLARLLGGVAPRRVLDFGCGAGRSLPYLSQFFSGAECWGYDVSPESLKFAVQAAPRARLSCDWDVIEQQQFDVIFAANVFHHIVPADRVGALERCRRLLAPGGKLFLFEHNPFNPLTRRVFERCPFDADAEMFSLGQAREMSRQAGFSQETHGYTLFFPKPLAWLRGLEPLLTRLPLGAQYYVQMAS
ncbi:trans-aconitate 2-methyltransferase [Acidovorax sp. Leaf73]|uniref:class I SAM-dependent methyltransferase n=1 Tax=Acidovorax sp. Leaf73 TaxID=2876566 RepID=UPI001E40E32D|nr:class I SAM-dependent methyltransferase [Acidovorax sp. Leaf73]